MKKLAIAIIILVFLFMLPTVFAGGGSPPPPPPPCAQKLQGCYDQKDIKTGPGSQSPQDFGYYIAQTACIPGGCTCSLSSFVDDVRQVNPDESAGACSCITGTAWVNNVRPVSSASEDGFEEAEDQEGAEGGEEAEDQEGTGGDEESGDGESGSGSGSSESSHIGCCGDDKNDCGVLAEEIRHGRPIHKHLCAMTSDLLGSWITAKPNLGDIAYLGCNDREYLATNEGDSGDWIMCKSFEFVEIEKNKIIHEYVCTGKKGREAWIECCGSEACHSSSAGLRLTSGNSVKVGETTYYCKSNGMFSTDLDNVDKPSCEGARFDWTGNLCCSEADDDAEYYNDASGELGGCWNKNTVFSGDPVPEHPNVANFEGLFFGCNIDDPDLLKIKDYHTGAELIENKETCFQDEGKFYLCKTDGTWEVSGRKDFSHHSFVVPEVNPDPLEESGCCAPDRCWDGSQCAENQKTNPNAPAVNGFRCVDGNWTDAEFKGGPEEDVGGFCPESEQCLVSPFGRAKDNNQIGPDKKPQCITDGQFIGNHYCQDGFWTTRTKFVAQQLLEMAKNKEQFVVFCDKPKKALRNLEFIIQGTVARQLVEARAENFCVLSFDGTVRLGITLIDGLESDDSILDLINTPDCNNAYNNNDDTYRSCGGGSSSVAWYNSKLKTLIYSPEAFPIEGSTGFDSLKDLFNNIVDKVSGATLQPFNVQFVDNLRRFEKLYVGRNGIKEIRGTVEGFSSKRLLIEYKNFDTNICDFVGTYNQKFGDAGSRIICEQQGTNFIVLAEGSDFTKINPDDVWNDLTSKLRVS